MIRGRKPQAYDTSTKTTDSLLIPAISIDFSDQKDLETKAKEIIENIEGLDQRLTVTEDVVNSDLEVPRQLGTVVYNGELQSPVLDVRSSRIVMSGELVGRDVKTYTATATLLNGSWKTTTIEPLAATQPVVWNIVPKKIPEPSVNSIYLANGKLQEVKLCNYNPNYCKITGTTSARGPGTYSISVSIIDDNVTWEDGTRKSIPLYWDIVESNGNSEEITALITELTAEITTIKNTIKTLQRESEADDGSDHQCPCAPIIESLKRRIILLEFFTLEDDFDMSALIALLTRLVEELERNASNMDYETLDAEIKTLLSAIDKALNKATKQADIDALNSLRTRVLNLYSLYVKNAKLLELLDTVKRKKKEIQDMLDEGDVESAEKELKKLKETLKEITDSMSDDETEEAAPIINEITNDLDDIDKMIKRKKLQQKLDIIEENLKQIKDKINNNEDPTDLIETTKELIDEVIDKAKDEFPFEKDKALTAKDKLNDLEKLYAIKKRINELNRVLDDIAEKINVYDNETLEEKISSAKTELEQIKELLKQFDPNPFEDDITDITAKLTTIENLFWKKKKEQELEEVKRALETINTAVLAADPNVDNMDQWNSQLADLEKIIDDISTEAREKGILPDNLAVVKELLETVKRNIRNAKIYKIIADLNAELDDIMNKMIEGTITYEEVKTRLDDIETRIAALEDDNNSDDVKDAIILLYARVADLRQLNEDMRIYLEVKPMLNAIRQKIYDEDLDILWKELGEAEAKLEGAGRSRWIIELINDIEEIKDILNSFSKNNTVENVLNHVKAVLEIAVTVEDFEPTGTTYDEVKLDLERLAKAALSVTDEPLTDFPSWYSLSDEDKAYSLENNLRKIRRNIITTEDLQKQS